MIAIKGICDIVYTVTCPLPSWKLRLIFAHCCHLPYSLPFFDSFQKLIANLEEQLYSSVCFVRTTKPYKSHWLPPLLPSSYIVPYEHQQPEENVSTMLRRSLCGRGCPQGQRRENGHRLGCEHKEVYQDTKINGKLFLVLDFLPCLILGHWLFMQSRSDFKICSPLSYRDGSCLM